MKILLGIKLMSAQVGLLLNDEPATKNWVTQWVEQLFNDRMNRYITTEQAKSIAKNEVDYRISNYLNNSQNHWISLLLKNWLKENVPSRNQVQKWSSDAALSKINTNLPGLIAKELDYRIPGLFNDYANYRLSSVLEEQKVVLKDMLEKTGKSYWQSIVSDAGYLTFKSDFSVALNNHADKFLVEREKQFSKRVRNLEYKLYFTTSLLFASNLVLALKVFLPQN